MKTKTLPLLMAVFTLCLFGPASRAVSADYPIANGPYQGTMESLKQYKCPDWFRDAKFGIWAHWGPQAVPMDGDWYARGMYEPGNKHYKYQLEHYGHPSTNGYKDIIPLWKAEKWDPDRLMAMYKKAGAKYFVSMGCHHDNFDLWNSKYHKWNAVNMGPHRDVVGDWQKAATKYGLRFGVSEHMGASFTWFQASHGADKTGPLAGVPYDGADPRWEDLYHQKAAPDDKDWYSKDPRWHQEWFTRLSDLIDNYHLDLLYTDGGVPFGNEAGRSMIAHLYNTDLKDRGSQQVVYCCKQQSGGRWIEDLERGVMPRINPDPWQTDTSIGDWYYNRDWKFRPVSWVIHMLADIVSKNGNLLLNVVQRPDGSLDPEVEQTLGELADWNAVNGEAIFATRPWLVYGEGAVKTKGGHFKEDFAYSSKDIRFTTKGDALYAIALGWPETGELQIGSLASRPGERINGIRRVELLGYKDKLDFSQTEKGLSVRLPAGKPCKYAFTLRISGTDLKPVEVPQTIDSVRPDTQGRLNLLPDTAELHGDKLNAENQGGEPNIGSWDNAEDWISWKVLVPNAGTYKVKGMFAAANGDSALQIQIGGQKIVSAIPKTASWADFAGVELGTITIGSSGEVEVKVAPGDPKAWKPVNLRSITLAP